jgi:heptosyltransferase II
MWHRCVDRDMMVIIQKNILVAQTMYLGDLILTLPMIQRLKDTFPSTSIDVLVGKGREEALRHNPYITTVLVYDKKVDRGLKGIFSVAKRLRTKRYDAAIITPGSIRTAIAVYLARIPMRIGTDQSTGIQLLIDRVKFQKESWQIPGGKLIRLIEQLWQFFGGQSSFVSSLFTDTVVLDKKRHAVERHLQLLEPLGIHAKWDGVLSPLCPDNIDVSRVEGFLSERIKPSKAIVAVAPGSSWNTKRWLEERYIEVIKRIATQNISVVLIGGSDDVDVCNRIAVSVDSNLVVNSSGKLSVLESAALLRKCKMLLTNESGAMHIASAMGTPCIVLMGPTVPEFGFTPVAQQTKLLSVEGLWCRPCTPFGGKRCPTGTFDCMKQITVEMVYKAVIRMTKTNPDTQEA